VAVAVGQALSEQHWRTVEIDLVVGVDQDLGAGRGPAGALGRPGSARGGCQRERHGSRAQSAKMRSHSSALLSSAHMKLWDCTGVTRLCSRWLSARGKSWRV